MYAVLAESMLGVMLALLDTSTCLHEPNSNRLTIRASCCVAVVLSRGVRGGTSQCPASPSTCSLGINSGLQRSTRKHVENTGENASNGLQPDRRRNLRIRLVTDG